MAEVSLAGGLVENNCNSVLKIMKLIDHHPKCAHFQIPHELLLFPMPARDLGAIWRIVGEASDWFIIRKI